MSDLISVTQAAQALGCTRQNVHRLIKDGQIKAVTVGDFYVIRRDVLEGYVRQQAQALRDRAQALESSINS